MGVKDIDGSPDAIERIKRLRMEGHGYNRIADDINGEFSLGVSFMDVKRWLAKHGTEITYALEESEELKKDVREEILDNRQQMKDVNDHLWKLFNEATDLLGKVKGEIQKGSRDALTLIPALKAVESILSSVLTQLKIQSQYMTKLGESTIKRTKKLNIIDFSTRIFEMLPDLEKQGYIEIKKDIPEIGIRKKKKKIEVEVE